MPLLTDGFIDVKLVPQDIFNEEMILWVGCIPYVNLNMDYVNSPARQWPAFMGEHDRIM